MNQKIDFLLAGVGGQGTLLASDILAEIGLRAGYDVKKSEVHGMAQRGGSVTSHVRWADKVYAPLIGQGEVDYLLAFERLDGLRYVEQLRPDGTLVVSEHGIPPISVTAGKDEYPTDEQIRRVFGEVAGKVIWVPPRHNASRRSHSGPSGGPPPPWPCAASDLPRSKAWPSPGSPGYRSRPGP